VLKAIFYPEAKTANLQDLDELNRFFWAWLERHYTHKVHSETSTTPIDRWEAGREHVRLVTPDELADTFLWEDERFVGKTGEVAIGGNRYPVDPALIGTRVVVRYDPFDMSEVRIVLHGQTIGNFRPAELVNRTFSKAQPHPPAPPGRLSSSEGFKERLLEGAKGRHERWVNLAAGQGAGVGAQDFVLQMSQLLGGRVFDAEDQKVIEAFRRRHHPLVSEVIQCAVLDAATLKGTERPLPYYLECLHEAVRNLGGLA
jgi:hypothetical protein